MERLILTPLILLAIQCFSQLDMRPVEIRNNSLTEPNLKLLYSGVNNEIQIIVPDNVSNYEFKTVNTYVLETKDPSTFILVPENNLYEDTIKIYFNRSLVQSEVYTIAPLPPLSVQVGENKNLTVSVEDFLSDPVINVISTGHFATTKEVVGFSIEIVSTDGSRDQFIGPVKGHRLLSGQGEAIENLKSGDKIIIGDITAWNEDGKVKIKSVTYTIE